MNGLCFSQIHYTKHFDAKMKNMGLEANTFPEFDFLAQPCTTDKTGFYDLCLIDELRSKEVWVGLKEQKAVKGQINFPHIMFMNHLSSIATNDDEFTIQIYSADSGLEKHIKSDWVLTAKFRPKKDMTERSLGQAVIGFKEDRGYFLLVILYDQLVYAEEILLQRMLNFL